MQRCLLEEVLCERGSSSLNLLVLIEAAAIGAVGVDTTSRLELIFVIDSTMDVLLEDRIGLDMLEFGLEVLEACSVAAAVGATTGVVHGEARVLDFFALNAPV